MSRKPSPASRPAEDAGLDLPIAGWIVEPDGRDKLPLYKTPMRLTLPVKDELRAVMNNQPGVTHVAIGDVSRETETWYVVNLTTGTAAPPVKVVGDFDPRERGVSGDGSFLALRTDGRMGKVVVVNTANSQVQDVPDAGGDKQGEIDIIGFATPEKLVVINRVDRTNTIMVYNCKTQAVEHTMPGGPGETPHYAFSPTGRYLALGSQRGLSVWDLTTGQSAGSMTFTKDTNTSSVYDYLSRNDANCLSWSPDGKELAMRVGGSGSQNRVMSVSTASGRLRLEQPLIPVESLDSSYQRDDAKYFQCLPDNSGYLSGYTIYDVATGNPVYDTRAIGVEANLPLLRIMDTNTLFACSNRGGGGGVILVTAKLPRAEIDKALESVRGGGKSFDVTMPPLAKANVDMVQPVGVLAPEGWDIQPDLIKDRKPLAFNSQPLRGTMAKNATVDYRLRQLIFTGAPANQAMISYDVMPKQQNRARYAMPPTSTKTVVDRISLDNKGILAAFELPPSCRVTDATTDGKMLMTRMHDRIDIWKAPPEGSSAKPTHVVGWRPWEGSNDKDNTAVRFAVHRGGAGAGGPSAVILSPTRVLTFEYGKALTVWSIPECTALWTAPLSGTEGGFAVSPGRKHIALSTSAGVAMFDSATGACLARLEGSEGLNGALAFHPDGSKLAMVSRSMQSEIGDEVCSWDLTTGKLTSRFYFPKIMSESGGNRLVRNLLSNGRPTWAGADQLLIGRSQLLDLTRMTPTWRFVHSAFQNYMGTSTETGLSIDQPPDERLWAITSQQSGHLVAITVPSKDMRQALIGVPMQPELAVEPGSKVTVDCQLPDPVLQKEWRDRMIAAVKAQGWEVADNQPIKLVAAIHRSSRTETYGQGFWGRVNQQTVSIPQLKLEIALSVEGQTVWAYAEHRGGSVKTWLEQGQTLQGEADKLNANLDKTFLSNFPSLPPRIIKLRTGKGFGASMITPTGLQPYTGQLPD